jgi:hypothetical protein
MTNNDYRDFDESLLALIPPDMIARVIVRAYTLSRGLDWGARASVVGLRAVDFSEGQGVWWYVEVVGEEGRRWVPRLETEWVLGMVPKPQRALAVVLLCAATGDRGGEWSG